MEMETVNTSKENLFHIGTKININTQHDYVFRWSCANGYREVAEWLYELSKIDGNIKININVKDDCAFTWLCTRP
jgi:hypothetical protein